MWPQASRPGDEAWKVIYLRVHVTVGTGRAGTCVLVVASRWLWVQKQTRLGFCTYIKAEAETPGCVGRWREDWPRHRALIWAEVSPLTASLPQVFLRAGVASRLERQREQLAAQSLVLLQATCRGFLSRQALKKLKVLWRGLRVPGAMEAESASRRLCKVAAPCPGRSPWSWPRPDGERDVTAEARAGPRLRDLWDPTDGTHPGDGVSSLRGGQTPACLRSQDRQPSAHVAAQWRGGVTACAQ
jgi:hypothetical protein